MRKIFLMTLLSSLFLLGGDIDSSVVKKLHLSKGKTYVIDFFASWCHSCRVELPELSKINGRGITVIGVDVDQKLYDGKKFQAQMRKENKLTFRVINDPKGVIISKFNPPGVPALYVVKNNKILGSIIGAKSNIAKRVLDMAR